MVVFLYWTKIKMTNAEEQSQVPNPTLPRIVYGEGTDPGISVDTGKVAQTMRDLGVSEQGINETTLYVDPKSRLQTFGTHYPNKVGRLRFRSNPEIQEAKGDIVRLSTIMKGKARSADEINRTMVHELEHRAQGDRHDSKLTEGHLAVWGLAVAGAILGNRLGKNKASKIVGTAIGAGIGHSLGYMIAPHERQARERARQVTTKAVVRK